METNIYAKLAAAQAEMKQPVFDAENPHFHSKYASLASVMDSVLPALIKHGLFLSQSIEGNPANDTQLIVTTTVFDDRNRADLAAYPVNISGMNPQQIGSAITYAKRYSLASAFARVADTDDDGNTASEPPKRKAKKPAPKKQPEVITVDDRSNANSRLWVAIQKYAKQEGRNAREIVDETFKERAADDWSIEELEDKAAEFEGAINE